MLKGAPKPPAFDRAFDHTIGLEGVFVDDPSDSGGATRFGITERVARANGYDGPMESLPLDVAKQIARAQYWDTLRLDAVAELSPALASELFDTAYNMGIARAGKFLQEALNAMNREGSDYPDVTVDGLVGPLTTAALRAYVAIRGIQGTTVLLRALNCLQGAAYIELSQRRPKDERFVFGWLLNRVA
jgi:lysozyme family protein